MRAPFCFVRGIGPSVHPDGDRRGAAESCQHDSSLIQLANDLGVGNVPVTAYDRTDNIQGAATTSANGSYTLNAAGTGPYRIQFTSLPAGFFSGPRGPDSGTTVQFVPDGSSSNISLGLV